MQYLSGNKEVGAYLRMSPRKVGLLQKYGLIHGVRSDHCYIYSTDDLDQFMKDWSGYSLRNEEEIKCAIRMKNNGIAGDQVRNIYA